eukprot:Rmarinus@m.17397
MFQRQTVDLDEAIHRVCESAYRKLKRLCDSDSGTSVERRKNLLDYAYRSQYELIRLLVLVRWIKQASVLEDCQEIISKLATWEESCQEIPDSMYFMQERLQNSKIPLFDIPTAIDVLTTGTYARLPSCIGNEQNTVDSLDEEKLNAIRERLTDAIRLRLLTTPLPDGVTSVEASGGVARLLVRGEFAMTLTLMDDRPDSPWSLTALETFMKSEIFEGESELEAETLGFMQTGGLLSGIQYQKLCNLIQLHLNENESDSVVKALRVCHEVCICAQLEALRRQALELANGPWGDTVEVRLVGNGTIQELDLCYWSEAPTVALHNLHGVGRLATEAEVDALGKRRTHSEVSSISRMELQTSRVSGTAQSRQDDVSRTNKSQVLSISVSGSRARSTPQSSTSLTTIQPLHVSHSPSLLCPRLQRPSCPQKSASVDDSNGHEPTLPSQSVAPLPQADHAILAIDPTNLNVERVLTHALALNAFSRLYALYIAVTDTILQLRPQSEQGFAARVSHDVVTLQDEARPFASSKPAASAEPADAESMEDPASECAQEPVGQHQPPKSSGAGRRLDQDIARCGRKCVVVRLTHQDNMRFKLDMRTGKFLIHIESLRRRREPEAIGSPHFEEDPGHYAAVLNRRGFSALKSMLLHAMSRSAVRAVAVAARKANLVPSLTYPAVFGSQTVPPRRTRGTSVADTIGSVSSLGRKGSSTAHDMFALYLNLPPHCPQDTDYVVGVSVGVGAVAVPEFFLVAVQAKSRDVESITHLDVAVPEECISCTRASAFPNTSQLVQMIREVSSRAMAERLRRELKSVPNITVHREWK